MEQQPQQVEQQQQQVEQQQQMEQDQQKQQQLCSGLTTEVIAAPLEKAWEVASDFYGLHKWVPTVQRCYEVQPGVRRAETRSSGQQLQSPQRQPQVVWVHEALVAMSPRRHSLTYRIEDGNMGLERYEATMQLRRSDSVLSGGTRVNWSFQMCSRSARSREEQEAFLRWGIRNLEAAAGAAAGGATATTTTKPQISAITIAADVSTTQADNA